MIYIYYDKEDAVIAAETKKFVESTNTFCTALPQITSISYNVDTACTTSNISYSGTWDKGAFQNAKLTTKDLKLEDLAKIDTSKWIGTCDSSFKNNYCTNIQLEIEHKMFNWFKI